MSTIFTHQSGYLISVKSLKNGLNSSLKGRDVKFGGSEYRQLENALLVASPQKNINEFFSSEQIDKFLLIDEEAGDYTEIQPNFSKTDIIINNFLLILFTIIAGTLALVVTPVFIVPLVKTCFRNIINKNPN